MRFPLFLSLFFLMASKCSSTSERHELPWEKNRATNDLKVLSASPHPMGSPRIAELADYLEKQMQAEGLQTGRDTFTALVPDPDLIQQPDTNPMRSLTLPLTLRNIYAKLKVGRESCAYVIASHYDSKRLPGREGEGVGANDSGSSSVALLELMRGMKALSAQQALDLRCHIVSVWFDGEEAYLPEWRDGQTRHPARIVDNTYGSRQLADNLQACGGTGEKKVWCLPDSWGGERLEGVILLDMVGSPALKLTPETGSTRQLLDTAIAVDKRLFEGQMFGNSIPKRIEDDHVAFIEKGIPALDLIDFENLETWHQPSDTFESVSIESIEKSARFTLAILQAILSP